MSAFDWVKTAVRRAFGALREGWLNVPRTFRGVFRIMFFLFAATIYLSALPWETNLPLAQVGTFGVLLLFLVFTFFGLRRLVNHLTWALPAAVLVLAFLPGTPLRFFYAPEPAPLAAQMTAFATIGLLLFMMFLEALNFLSKTYTRLFLPFRYGVLGGGIRNLRYYHVFAGLWAAITRPRIYAVCRYMCANDGNELRRLLAVSKRGNAKALGKTLPLLAHRLGETEFSEQAAVYERFLSLDVESGVLTAFLKSKLPLDVCLTSLEAGIPLEYAAALSTERLELVPA